MEQRLKAIIATLMFLIIFISTTCSEARAALGKPLPGGLLDKERGALIAEVSKSPAVRSLQEVVGKEKFRALLERLPDRELELLAQDPDLVISGGSRQDSLGWIGLGFLIILLLAVVLGIIELFDSGKPIGKAQYEARKKELQEQKKAEETQQK